MIPFTIALVAFSIADTKHLTSNSSREEKCVLNSWVKEEFIVVTSMW